MRTVPNWLVPTSMFLGIILGIMFVWLYFRVVSYVRQWRGHGPGISADLLSILEELPLLSLIFDRSLSLVAQNRLARKEAVKLEAIQQNSWFSSYLREARQSQNPIVRPSNEDDPFWVHVFALQDGHLVVLIADEQEKYDTENLRRDFIANASHELNTPVAAISLLAEAIQQASSDPERSQKFAESITKEVHRLSALTRDIARLSEAQSGWEDDDLQILSLREVATHAVQDHQNLANSAGVELVLGAADAVDYQVRADERNLHVSISNLIENAIQHSIRGGRVGVAVTGNAVMAMLAVTDQGEGIDKSEQDKVFKRFYRIDTARTRRSGGTGLGLSIARNIARSFRGDLVLWSMPDIGSTFTMKLPVANEEK